MVGTLGDAAIFSLGKGKQLNAVAGGVLTTRHRELAAHAAELQSCVAPPGRLQVLRTLALARAMDLATRRGAFDLMLWPGLRGAARMGSDPLTDLFEDNPGPLPVTGPPAAHRRLGGAQAILAREGLARYPVALKRRREIWRRLVEAAERGGCTVQRPTAETAPAPLEVALRTPNRARAQADLRARGIDSQRTWMAAPSSLPAFAANAGGPFPVAEALAKELLYLPFYPGLEDAAVERLEATLERPPPSLRFHFP